MHDKAFAVNRVHLKNESGASEKVHPAIWSHPAVSLLHLHSFADLETFAASTRWIKVSQNSKKNGGTLFANIVHPMCKCANLVQMCLLLNIVAAAAASAAAELCSVYLQFTVSRLVGACSAALCRQACSSWAAEELSADLTLLLFLTHNHPPGCHSS